MSLQKQTQTCIVCQGVNLRAFWRVLKKCASCGHCVADINLNSLDFSRIYEDGYFAGEEYEDYLGDRQVFKRQFEDRLHEVMLYRKEGDLIEIGCAYGFFLELAKAFFSVRGFDICRGPVRFAQEQLGLPASCEDFSRSSVPPESADIVAMWDTIEHLPRPDLTLQAASQALRLGGYIFLTTGDIGSLLARIRRENWRLIHPPTHLHYFSRRSIQELLRNTGFETVSVNYVGTRRSLGQVAFSLWQVNKGRPSRLYHLIARSRLSQFSFVLNTRDIMLVVARKA